MSTYVQDSFTWRLLFSPNPKATWVPAVPRSELAPFHRPYQNLSHFLLWFLLNCVRQSYCPFLSVPRSVTDTEWKFHKCLLNQWMNGWQQLCEACMGASSNSVVQVKIQRLREAESLSQGRVSEWVSEVAQSCPTLCNPMGCSPPGSSVHGIFQTRILEWVAISFSRGSSGPRYRTWVSCIAGMLYHLSHQGIIKITQLLLTDKINSVSGSWTRVFSVLS